MQSHPKNSFEVKEKKLFHAALPIDIPSSTPSLSSTSCSSSDTEAEDGLCKQLVLYDPTANGNREIEAVPDPDPIQFQPPPLLTYSARHAPRVLPSVGAFTVQCAECFKWRLIPTKQRYEAIREHILEVPFVCEAAREWWPDISCHDPEDISQDGSRLWAIDKPNIAQPPPGWQRLLRIRGEESTKFADVYYASPSGKRLRSMVEIQKYLVENPEYIRDGVTMSQFSFQIPKPLQENYVRKRPASCMGPYDGTNLGMPRTLELEEEKRWEEDEQHKKFSERGKKNRSSDCGGKGQPKHTLGRKNLAVKKTELVATPTREPTSIELFQESHKRRDESFIDERAVNVNTELEMTLEEAKRKLPEEGREDDALPTHEEQKHLYLNIVGTSRRNHVYGMGNQSQALLRRRSFSTQTPYSSCLHDPFGNDLNYRTLMQRHLQELSVGFNMIQQAFASSKADRKKSENTMKKRFSKWEKMLGSIIHTLESEKKNSSKKSKKKASQVVQEEDDDDEVQDSDDDDDDDDDDDEVQDNDDDDDDDDDDDEVQDNDDDDDDDEKDD